MPPTWNDLEISTNGTALATFGQDATFLPQDGQGGSLTGQTISVIPVRPGVPGDFSPGFGQGQVGALVWVNLVAISPTPRQGDLIVYDGQTYILADKDPDTGGGAVLKLRAK